MHFHDQQPYDRAAITAVLNDIANELSSIEGREIRLEHALSLISGVLPSDVVALATHLGEWRIIYSPEPDDAEELEILLRQHYGVMAGEPMRGTGIPSAGNRRAIRRSDAFSSSFISVPVIGADKVLGVLHMRSDQPEAYSEGDVTVLAVMAARFGAYLKEVHAYAEAEHAQKSAERMRRLCSALSLASTTINSTRNSDEVAKRVIWESARAIGCESAGVALREGEAWVVRHTHNLPVEVDGRVLADREVVFVAGARGPVAITDTDHGPGASHEILKRHGLRSALFIPLTVENEPIGSLFFAYHSKQVHFTEVDIDFAEKMGSTLSLGLENARLFEELQMELTERKQTELELARACEDAEGRAAELATLKAEAEARAAEAEEERRILEEAYAREHHIADVLQRALMPPIGLHLPGYAVHAHYEPALREAEVGGDFYDVFNLTDGRIAFVMGDVSGKGLRAAVQTAMAKYMLQAYANENPEPESVLERLNQAISDYTGDDSFITVFYGILDPAANTLTYANAGHEMPLIYSRVLNRILTLDVTGRAIGIMGGATYSQLTLVLAPGDTVLMYTDGITDAGGPSELFGVERLSEALIAHCDCDEHRIIEAVVSAATNFGGGRLRDDAAVLVLKTTPA